MKTSTPGRNRRWLITTTTPQARIESGESFPVTLMTGRKLARRPDPRSKYGRGVSKSNSGWRVKFGKGGRSSEVGTFESLEEAQSASSRVEELMSEGISMRDAANAVKEQSVIRKRAGLRVTLNGDVYGKLTVVDQEFLYRIQPSGPKRCVLCKCSCGRETVIVASNLKSGNTKQCGYGSCSTKGHSLRKRYGYEEPGYQARNVVYVNYRSNAAKRNRAFKITREEFNELVRKIVSTVVGRRLIE